jgi:hypothetical protein
MSGVDLFLSVVLWRHVMVNISYAIRGRGGGFAVFLKWNTSSVRARSKRCVDFKSASGCLLLNTVVSNSTEAKNVTVLFYAMRLIIER